MEREDATAVEEGEEIRMIASTSKGCEGHGDLPLKSNASPRSSNLRSQTRVEQSVSRRDALSSRDTSSSRTNPMPTLAFLPWSSTILMTKYRELSRTGSTEFPGGG